MPAPPPPPPMNAAATPASIFKPSKSSANDRDALLSSIRKGAKLKKAVTNDRSAPLVSGSTNKNTTNLKSGSRNESMPVSMISPMKNNFGSIQMELKKQLANDSRNRGPPPPAPTQNRNIISAVNIPRQPFIHKENVTNGVHHQSQLSLNTNSNLAINSSTLHRKAKSNVNLSTVETSENRNGFQPSRPVINHGKPNLAPKPPVLNSKSLALPIKNNKPISRTHSLKSPRTPSPQSPEANQMAKFGTVRHMSSIISQSLANSPMNNSRSRPALNGRPTAPPPSVPTQQTPNHQPTPSQPPPPPKINAVKHPNHAPPPPPPISTIPQAPSHAPPPPPPHKTQLNRPPVTVQLNNNTNPPPPPPRHSSMRDTSTHTNVNVNLEEKFKSLFQTPDNFPQPPPFKNVMKLYKPAPITKSGYVV